MTCDSVFSELVTAYITGGRERTGESGWKATGRGAITERDQVECLWEESQEDDGDQQDLPFMGRASLKSNPIAILSKAISNHQCEENMQIVGKWGSEGI